MEMLISNTARVDDFIHDPDQGFWAHPGQGKFGYSDGDKVERRMLNILRSANDIGLFSDELAAQVTDWPTQYHFSPARHNLLRHLRISRETSVLELGAGCGAITRQLGESAGEVWAVEGSRARAACAAARTRDLPNVRVFTSDFQRIDPDRQFDVVTLIGVLEYSPVFFDSENPFLECLKLARRMLRPAGVLVLAIENQLGLKYFCGAPEDHTGKPYDGVQDLYRSRGVQTRGRAELVGLLQDAGFPATKFQYPFPDYKLPSWVLTQTAMETPGFDPIAILRAVQSSHDGKRVNYSADERRIRGVLYRNGLLEHLANSFLALASGSDPISLLSVSDLSPPNLLAAGYSTSRQTAFNIATRMVVDESGDISVEKSPISPGVLPSGSDFVHVTGTEKYHTGQQLEQLFIESLTRHGLDSAITQLRRWIDFLIDQGLSVRDERDIFASTIKPEFFDCNPRNLIVAESGLVPIDLEWQYRKPLSLRTAILLYLKPLTSGEESLLKKYLKGRAPLPLQLARQLGVEFTRQQFRESSQERRQINRLIAATKPRQRGKSRADALRRPSIVHRIRKWFAAGNSSTNGRERTGSFAVRKASSAKTGCC